MKYSLPVFKLGLLLVALLLIAYAFTFPGNTINASEVFLRKNALYLGLVLLGFLFFFDYSQKKRK